MGVFQEGDGVVRFMGWPPTWPIPSRPGHPRVPFDAEGGVGGPGLERAGS